MDEARLKNQEAGPTAGPDFLCVGAQKAGTSWLYQQLSNHPDFWMPPRKELHYLNARGHAPIKAREWNRDERDVLFWEQLAHLGEKPQLDLPGYGRLFACKDSRLSGDITPAYCLLADKVIEEVMNCFPKLKVIFLARDPVERAWSQLSLDVRNGRLSDFDPLNLAEVIGYLRQPVIAQRSSPSEITARWLRYVPADQFRVYFFDDLQSDPSELRRSILEFLGGDPKESSGAVAPNQNTKAMDMKLPLSDKVRDGLAEFFAGELKASATELGGPATGWPDRYL
ncbi:MAG: sulfotransferase family protein [Chthoniobacterales bacterium]